MQKKRINFIRLCAHLKILVITGVFILMPIFSPISFSAEPKLEYQIKAAYLYKFLFFTEWPETSITKPEDTIIIGIIGKDSFGDAFSKISGEVINGKKLAIKRFTEDVTVETLQECHILFFSYSLKKNVSEVLKLLDTSPVLTVGEAKGFIESGGMINLIHKKHKVSFEVNKTATEHAGIKLRSKLLRVAERIVEG